MPSLIDSRHPGLAVKTSHEDDTKGANGLSSEAEAGPRHDREVEGESTIGEEPRRPQQSQPQRSQAAHHLETDTASPTLPSSTPSSPTPTRSTPRFVWRFNGGRRSNTPSVKAMTEAEPQDDAGSQYGQTASIKDDRDSDGGCPSCRRRSKDEEEDLTASYSSIDASPDDMPAVGLPTAAWPASSPTMAPSSMASPQMAAADDSEGSTGPAPERIHDFKHDSSVLALAVSDDHIFAGTHDGEILVWALDSFQLIHRVQAHKRSIMSLFLSSPGPATTASSSSANGNANGQTTSSPASPTAAAPSSPGSPSTKTSAILSSQLLISSAGDATVSIWCPKTFRRIYEIYSTYDVGDIFSVAYSPQFHTVFVGAQNTTIQWVDLSDPRRRVPQDSAQHPDKRHHRFFDSKAVGGTSTPRPNDERWGLIPKAQTVLEVHRNAIRQFAHYGYVYCMLMAKGPAHNLSADEEVLISGGGDGTVKLWKIGPDATAAAGDKARDGDGAVGSSSRSDSDGDDCGTISEVMTLGNDDGMSVLSLAIDGSFLYSGKIDGLIELWDLDTRQKLRVIKAHDDDIMTLQMKWGFLWSASADGYCAKHSTVHYEGDTSSSETVSQKYQCIARWKGHDGKILASANATYKNQRLYITGANDEVVTVWRLLDKCSSDTEATEEPEDVMLKNLREFVAYKTISSRPEYAEDCHKGATFLCTLFKRLGGEVQMLLTRDKLHNPVVYAKFAGKPHTTQSRESDKDGQPAPRKRILFYGHYDVVPADAKKNKWATDPFTVKGMNGYLYGRGVSDNKGPTMAALYAVADLMQAKQLESDVIFLIEGEEESGSRGFQETVREHRGLIGHIDCILLANSYWLDDETPCLTYGLRGVLHATVCVDSPHPDLHSGVDGSYMMAEPLTDLTMVLSKLKGPRNRVMLPNFYDGVLPLKADEEARFDAITSMLVQRNPENGPATLLKASLMSRWREPNLTIHRYKVSGPDGSLVSSHACANISLRLVPGQELDEVVESLETFLRDQFAALESTNHLTVHIDNKAEPWLGDPDNYIFRTLEEAIVHAWGMGGADDADGDKTDSDSDSASDSSADGAAAATAKAYKARRPLYIREGGSIPAIRFLEKQFGAPAAHLPCGQASDAAHLDNERLRVVNLQKSREIFKRVFQKL